MALSNWQEAMRDWSYEDFALEPGTDADTSTLNNSITVYEGERPVRVGNEDILHWGIQLDNDRLRSWPLYKRDSSYSGWETPNDDRLDSFGVILDLVEHEGDDVPDTEGEAVERVIGKIMELISDG